MTDPDKKPYNLDGKEFAFWGQPNMDALIDAAIAYARTGKLVVPDIKSGSIPDPHRFIEFAVRGLATGTPVYMSNGESVEADPRHVPINYEHHKRSRELIDVVAKNVKERVSTIHPDCTPKKSTGMALG